MATNDVAWAAVRHCRADATLVALVGSATRIGIEKPKDSALPYLHVQRAGGYDVTHSQSMPRLNFTVVAAPTGRSKCDAIQARLRAMFHDKSLYTLGAGNATVKVTRSMRSGPPDVVRDEDQGPWYGTAFYEFQVSDSAS